MGGGCRKVTDLIGAQKKSRLKPGVVIKYFVIILFN
jgi:hypothetical protein